MSTIYLSERQKEILAHNARIVGGLYVHPQPYPCPVGLERTQGPSASSSIEYETIFFGAARDWQTDDDGYKRVRTQKKRRSRNPVRFE